MVVIGVSAPLILVSAEQARADVGTARIVRSADGVLLRADPSFGAEVLTTLSEGSSVDLRTNEHDTVYDPDGVTRWWPVRSDIGDGWVAGFYLEIEGFPAAATTALSAPPPAMDPETALATGTGASTLETQQAAPPPPGDVFLEGPYAVVNEPDGVNLRAEPGAAAPNLRSLSMETVVELRVDEADTVWIDGSRWWPVRIDEQDGWIIGSYLSSFQSSAAVPEPAAPAAPAAPVVPDLPAVPGAGDVPTAQEAAAGAGFAPGSYVAALTDDGSGLLIRADGAPNAEQIGSIPESDVVQVMDGPFYDPLGTGWYLITTGEVSGFVNGGWLSAATQPLDPAASGVPSVPEMPDAAPAAGLATGSIGLPTINATLTQNFGCSPYWWWYPFDANLGCNVHDGLDLASPMYTPLYAADGGIVEYAGWCDCGLGYYVKIDHLNGFKTTYGHMAAQPIVQTGQAVAKGQEIGPMGATGIATGSHTHFMVQLNGVTVDPNLYVR